MCTKKMTKFISVLRIQKLPPEKVVKLFEDMNDGKVALLSIYRSRSAQIGMKSDVLEKFVSDMQETRTSAMNKLIRKLSRRWYNEDQEGIPSQEEHLDTEDVSSVAPPGFHSTKML